MLSSPTSVRNTLVIDFNHLLQNENTVVVDVIGPAFQTRLAKQLSWLSRECTMKSPKTAEATPSSETLEKFINKMHLFGKPATDFTNVLFLCASTASLK